MPFTPNPPSPLEHQHCSCCCCSSSLPDASLEALQLQADALESRLIISEVLHRHSIRLPLSALDPATDSPLPPQLPSFQVPPSHPCSPPLACLTNHLCLCLPAVLSIPQALAGLSPRRAPRVDLRILAYLGRRIASLTGTTAQQGFLLLPAT